MSGMFSLEGRVALVTGASRGLGFAMAKALAENGAKVVVNARNGDELAAAAAKIGAEAMAFDVTDAVDASFNTRVKMGQSSNVYAVAMMGDGRVLFAGKEIKVTLGGCGG